MRPTTHLAIDRRLCGELVELGPGRAVVALEAVVEMGADAFGLVHGGFVFGLADHAAMLAVNEPTVVLGAAEVRFLKPVAVGEELTAVAEVEAREGKKARVAVEVLSGEGAVFTGTFSCFIPDQHVLTARRVGT